MHKQWTEPTNYFPAKPGGKDIYNGKMTNAAYTSPIKEDWTTAIKASSWNRLAQVWEDFADCDYEERCDALFAIVEEIMGGKTDVVSRMANCPERGSDAEAV